MPASPEIRNAGGEIRPTEIFHQIIESSGLRSTLLSEVFLSLPDSETTLAKAEMETLDFSSGVRVKHDHRGVGACVEFSANADGSEVRSERVSGRVFARAGWARTADGVVLAPPKEQWSPPVAPGREG